MLQEYCKS